MFTHLRSPMSSSNLYHENTMKPSVPAAIIQPAGPRDGDRFLQLMMMARGKTMQWAHAAAMAPEGRLFRLGSAPHNLPLILCWSSIARALSATRPERKAPEGTRRCFNKELKLNTHPAVGNVSGFTKPPRGGMSCRNVLGGGNAIVKRGRT